MRGETIRCPDILLYVRALCLALFPGLLCPAFCHLHYGEVGEGQVTGDIRGKKAVIFYCVWGSEQQGRRYQTLYCITSLSHWMNSGV